MTDDELDRLLRAARPATEADRGWADSEAGERALVSVRQRVDGQRGGRAVRGLRRVRPYGIGISLTAAAAVVIAVGMSMSGPTGRGTDLGGPPPSDAAPPPVGAVPQHMTLAAYDSCAAMLDELREHTAAHVTAYGLPGAGGYFDAYAVPAASLPVADGAAVPKTVGPDHSTTNNQEIGADEPDIVKTDGRRVVSVSSGVLRVVDARSHRVTGALDLQIYAGAASAQLLLSGDRVLVLLGAEQMHAYGGMALDMRGGPYGVPSAGSTVLLVDIAGAPKVIGTLHADGGYLDARLIDGIARVVVASAPRISFPMQPDRRPSKQANRTAIEQAPLSAWLPSYQTSAGGGTTTEHTVPCDRVSHPRRYAGTSILTVYSLDPAGSLRDPHPISVAADGGTVYASAADLYVASSDGRRTQLHRFYVGAPGAPRYVGSGSVPGWLFDSYSMSEYKGSLRVVTTDKQGTSLYVLDADTLRRRGAVGGLGVGEQLHAVRFLGDLAYVVTFRSVDPLYVLDLADPDHPRRAGELKVPGYSDYLHPTDDGRLLGVGQNVARQRVTGLQVSLFDVTDADRPTRLDVITRTHTPSETPIDPHAFLYWPATRTAVVPIDSWEGGESGAALVVHVGEDELRTIGTIRNPAARTADGYGSGIERTLVIGDSLWTMSSSGLQASDLHSLSRQAWIPFS